MRYFGGKHRVASWLRDVILPLAQGRRIVEPFCGGLSATVALQPKIASDSSKYLITLYRAVQRGWVPPTVVTEDDYRRIKEAKDPDDPLTAFVGHGCSFGGKWFGGYARDGTRRNYASEGSRGLVKKIAKLRDTSFEVCSYENFPVQRGDIVYCDPPYASVSHGYATDTWEVEPFWKWVEATSCLALVVVSEFSAPDGVLEVARRVSWSGVDGHNTGSRPTEEKLYVIGK